MLDWRNYLSYGIPVFFGFAIRWVNERRKDRKVDAKFQLVSSLGIAYFAYLFYRDRKVDIVSIELWLGIWSYFGSLVVTVGDNFFIHGWKAYTAVVLEKITNSLKAVKNESSNSE